MSDHHNSGFVRLLHCCALLGLDGDFKPERSDLFLIFVASSVVHSKVLQFILQLVTIYHFLPIYQYYPPLVNSQSWLITS